MARRRMTLKRIDPWTVLKFGFVANLALLAIWLLGAGIVWFFVRQLELIEKVCEIAGDVGFVECGVNGGNLFRALLLLGLLGTVIQTGLVVFLAFLHNLIADLVGGISFTYVEEGAGAAPTTRSAATTTAQQTRAQASAAPSASPPRPAPASPSAPPQPSSSPSQAPTQPSPSTAGSSVANTVGAPGTSSSPQTSSQTSSPASAPASTGGSPSTGGQPATGEPQRPSNPERPSNPDWDLFGPRGGSGGAGA